MSDQQEKRQRAGSSKGKPARSTSIRGRRSKGKGIPKHIPPQKEVAGDEGVGVSKIKAALRQTKRLLAKDNLSASVRQEAERKLIALEDEINTKETQQKERKNAQRSHKIRFFERQKLVRRIKKLKKSAAEGDTEMELLEARVLLNYVLHYPMTQKYVALFPNQGPSSISREDGETEREMSSSKEQSVKIKERIRQSMKKGEMSSEPEVELEVRMKDDQELPAQRKRLLREDEEEGVGPKQGRAKKERKKSNLEGDDFFAGEDDE